MTAEDADDEVMPRASVEAALAWLATRTPLQRAPRGALPGAIAALRPRLGRALPASLVEFLQKFHWIATHSVTTLAVESSERRTIETARRVIAEYVEATWRSLPRVDDTARANGEALLAWIPVVEIGNPLPFGSALFLDEAGAFRRASVREFPFSRFGDEATPSFTTALLTTLAAWHEG
ncbi:hypothetical protein SAMN02745121_05397 [Nannocystis exedens]|uniref:Uncharacterized protein n=1 Tax=Nannocystis exedens TaxID=54 RepID=A0A1I2D5R2_9BACT|nr:hypothetical protein [Nannocystis exedens]PCC70718.1 hypothetical protein NAEX_03782 [Nannocystis exedens]SFE75825.1 hypothetical protein SAMN02745121_05397 [Nannocystis exedens]